MIIYIDITQLYRGRANTGIQRVVKEFLQRAIKNDKDIIYKIIVYDSTIQKMQILPNQEIELFLLDIQNYTFLKKETIEIEKIIAKENTVFFDIDSAWNAPYKRDVLYPILKNNGFLIYNFIHDLIPILMPELVHDLTVKNFDIFIKTVYKYSDLVLFNSHSSQKDFIEYKDNLEIKRYIATRTVGLGSDFLQSSIPVTNSLYQELLDKKYILFVGTIEPRKNQEEVLDAFDILAQRFPDLHLVFIGKKGWKIDSLINKIKNHSLLNKRFYWFDDIDDDTLSHFYKNAFIVTYLSKYEGYGLPIVESLQYNNITIASKNSSMYEVGRDAADYIEYNTTNEIVDIISLYCENKEIYRLKKEYIKENFVPLSWDRFEESICDIFINYDKSSRLCQNHLKKLQFVFISIDKHNLEGTIKAIDKYVDCIYEYIVITQKKLISSFSSIQTKHKLILIDENDILGVYAKNFQKRDHVSKNWLLRTSLLNLDILQEEFIMLDDDNRPLKSISRDKFISQDGKYKAYYFYHLLDWHHISTDYDKAQQNMKKVLTNNNYELLSYSSHAPQIINKSILKEVVEKFFDLGLQTPIDEWSIYFNYAVSKYPTLFEKKLFETLNWPESPVYWDCVFNEKNISFENYYKAVYTSKSLHYTDTYEQKIEKKQKHLKPFIKTRQIFQKNKELLYQNNLVHGVIEFKNNDIEFYLCNIPYYFIVEQGSNLRLRLNYKLLLKNEKDLDVNIVIFYNEKVKIVKKIEAYTKALYQESIIEFPLISQGLNEGIYDITINIKVNDEYIYKEKSPYLMKLLVQKERDYLECLKNPSILSNKKQRVEKLKNSIKKVPLLGSVARWGYNILKINNIKNTLYSFIPKIKQLETKTKQLETKVKHYEIKTKQFETKVKHYEIKTKQFETKTKQLEDTMTHQISQEVAKQITIQSDSFQQRLDQFIFDTKIDLKLKDEKGE
ncbi:MAG: hypothetical protein CSA86_02610 [Arcobacter sp.]|nr:MAG: hypothetical protein CSA86_02610 [Arcobacter sp.]